MIHGSKPVVNMYEVDEDFMRSSKISFKNFGTSVSKEWALFVMNNRSRSYTDFSSLDCNLDSKYDIVTGPVADDDMAMQLFYNSETFDKLQDIETGLYLESAAYIYGLFQDERNFGRLVQAEI